ncbi:patatin-like phospholipase family protein, partial [bacterium]|nr:patatin-like phospholipase family protein [bacterium]
MSNKLKIGLALGGGGARGFAHIGVLKILNDAGINPEIVVGTSMGAVTGALYCQHQTAAAAEEKLRRVILNSRPDADKLNVYPENEKGDHFFDHITQVIKQRIVINVSVSKKSLLPAEQLEQSVDDLIEETLIEKLPVTYAAMASDLKTGKGIVLKRGSLRKAIIASSAIPGFFPPVPWNDYLLIDGEATDLIPVNACRALGADYVIAIDVQRNIETKREPKHSIDMFVRASRITSYHLAKASLNS